MASLTCDGVCSSMKSRAVESAVAMDDGGGVSSTLFGPMDLRAWRNRGMMMWVCIMMKTLPDLMLQEYRCTPDEENEPAFIADSMIHSIQRFTRVHTMLFYRRMRMQ